MGGCFFAAAVGACLVWWVSAARVGCVGTLMLFRQAGPPADKTEGWVEYPAEPAHDTRELKYCGRTGGICLLAFY